MIGLIGQSSYGLYALAISVINLFLMDMGLGTALTRFLSKCYAENRYDDANRYLRTAFAIYTVLALIVAVALLGSLPVLWMNLGFKGASVAAFIVFCLPCICDSICKPGPASCYSDYKKGDTR